MTQLRGTPFWPFLSSSSFCWKCTPWHCTATLDLKDECQVKDRVRGSWWLWSRHGSMYCQHRCLLYRNRKQTSVLFKARMWGFCYTQTHVIIPNAVFLSFLITAMQKHLLLLHQSPLFSQLQCHPLLLTPSPQAGIFRQEVPAWKSHMQTGLAREYIPRYFCCCSVLHAHKDFQSGRDFPQQHSLQWWWGGVCRAEPWFALRCYWSLESTVAQDELGRARVSHAAGTQFLPSDVYRKQVLCPQQHLTGCFMEWWVRELPLSPYWSAVFCLPSHNLL